MHLSQIGWVGSTVQIQEKGSSAADTGFYFLPESLCLSLIESNLKGDRSPLQVLQDQFVAWCAQITGHVMGGGR